jgi:hypothetical protein
MIRGCWPIATDSNQLEFESACRYRLKIDGPIQKETGPKKPTEITTEDKTDCVTNVKKSTTPSSIAMHKTTVLPMGPIDRQRFCIIKSLMFLARASAKLYPLQHMEWFTLV